MEKIVTPDTLALALSKMADADLVDFYGDTNVELKRAEAVMEALKAEINSRKKEEMFGHKFQLTCKEQISSRLDQKMVKEFLGDRFAKFCKDGVSTVIRVKAAVLGAAAA